MRSQREARADDQVDPSHGERDAKPMQPADAFQPETRGEQRAPPRRGADDQRAVGHAGARQAAHEAVLIAAVADQAQPEPAPTSRAGSRSRAYRSTAALPAGGAAARACAGDGDRHGEEDAATPARGAAR